MVHEEATIVADRVNSDTAQAGILTMMAISANLSKKGSRDFKKVLRQLGATEDNGGIKT